MDLNKYRIAKLFLGGIIATGGAVLTGIYEVNTITLFVIALGLSIFTIGIRRRLLGIITTVMGMNVIFIGLTYEGLDGILSNSVVIFGVLISLIGAYLQAKIFMKLINKNK